MINGNNSNSKMTVLISSCDKFSDIWKAQVALMNKYWPNRSCRTIILTDTNKNGISFPDVDIIEVGEGAEIIERMQEAVKHIDTEYVFLTLDDYMLCDFVKNDLIKEHINKMEEEDISYLRYYLRPKPKRKQKIKGEKGFYRCDLENNYQVNLYPSLWKRTFLENTLSFDIDNIWHYEVALTAIAKANDARCLISLNKEYSFVDTVRKGKFLHKGYRFLKKEGLYDSDRKINTWRYEISLAIRTAIMRHAPGFIRKLVKKIGRKQGKVQFSDYRIEFEKRINKDAEENS